MDIFYRILSYAKPFWKHLLASVVSTIFYTAMNGLSIYLTIPLLGTLFNEDNTEVIEKVSSSASTSILPDWFINSVDAIKQTFQDYILSGSIDEILLNISILIVLSFIFKNIFSYISSYFIAYVEQGIIRNFRNDLYQHILKLPLSFFKNQKSGDIISRFTNDVGIIQQSITQVFLNVFQEPLTVLVFFGIAFSISWKLTLFSLLIVPFSILIIASIGGLLRRMSYRLQQKLGTIVEILHETLAGMKIVKAFGMEEFEKKRFGDENQNLFKLIIKLIRVRNISSPSTEIIAVMLGAAIIYFGGQLVLVEHEIKASEFMAFLFAIFQMMPSLKKMSQVNNKIQESIGAGMRVFEILDTEPSIVDSEKPKDFDTFKNEIKFENVTFTYSDSEEKVLDGVNFTANNGEIIAFVGSSGAGKTTLADLIPRFFDPTGGKILMDGINIKDISVKDLRRQMGIVTQETILFNETVFNNIAYGLKDTPLDKVVEVAKIANAHEFIENMEKGYNTIVGEKGTKISGGQRQRLSIARALLKNPPIMIFDEATSALDNESEVLVQEAIEHLMKERTTFVIAHRLSTIRNADKIIVMDKGKIVQQGKHDDLLLNEDGVYKKLYELQFRTQA